MVAARVVRITVLRARPAGASLAATVPSEPGIRVRDFNDRMLDMTARFCEESCGGNTSILEKTAVRNVASPG
jgi:hypothetical protein